MTDSNLADLTVRARDMLARFPLIDGHNDLPWALRERARQDGGDLSQVAFDLDKPTTGLHTDLPRLAAGGVGAQFWSVYVPASLAGEAAVTAVLEQIDLARRMIARYPDSFGLALTDALDLAQAPVIFSHSSARALTDSLRNVPDEVLERLRANGGVCMVTFVPAFVSQECADWFAGLKEFTASKGLDVRSFTDIRSVEPEWTAAHPAPRATLSQVADHIEHVRSVAGIEHVGIGGDFDGTTEVTEGLDDVSTYPALFAELLCRGWSESDCRALAGGNILRVLRAAESYAAR